MDLPSVEGSEIVGMFELRRWFASPSSRGTGKDDQSTFIKVSLVLN
jgi:hypothetical protein